MTTSPKLLIAAALVMIVVPLAVAAPLQDAGTVSGRVIRADTSDGIAGAKVTLASGPVDPITLRALSTAGQTVGFFVPGPVNAQQQQSILQSIQADTAGI